MPDAPMMTRATPDGREQASDLRLGRVRAMTGPSIMHLAPVVVAELQAGALAAFAPADVDGMMPRLLAALPGLADGAAAAAATLASWGEALLRVTLELQRLAGVPPAFGRVVVDAPGEDRWSVAVAYDEEALARAALQAAARVLRDAVRGDDPEIEDVVRSLVRCYERARPGPTTLLMLEAARRRGIPVRRNPDDAIVQLGLGAAQRRLHVTMTDGTSVIATGITSDRHWTKAVLRRVGIGVPAGDTVRTAEEAVASAQDLGFPVLLKPLDASNGRGVSGRLDSLDAVREAWPLAVAEHPVVVVERFAQGNDHRVVVVNRRVVACVERIPAHVVGDGRRTIRALAESTNLDPNRSRTNPAASLSPLPLDERTIGYLARAGRTLDSVPDAGEQVFLRATANNATGGTAIDRTDEMHAVNRTLCELAAGAVGLDVAGLDVLTPDISVPFHDNGAVVIEIDASPGIRMHTHPDRGIARDVPGAILDMLYPPGAPVTIPVIAITGTNGKTTTTRLIAHLFRTAGKRTGFTTTDGVYYQEHLLLEGDLTGPFAAGIILSHPDVDVAVLETARGGIVRAGLGFDACDVGVVMNVTADHLGLGGIDTLEQLADVKAVIPAVVKTGGWTILNADDPLVLAMRTRTPGTVALFSTRADGGGVAIDERIAAGGLVARVEGAEGAEQLVIRHGATRVELGAMRDVPLTFGGAARFQVANVLAATLAAWTQGVPADILRAGIMRFVPSASRTPGRMNVTETTRGRVIIDYAHNAAAIEGLLDFVAALPAVHRMAVISVPGDRRDADLREIGSRAARMDYVIFKEHEQYRRGRTAGEGARLLTEGLLATGFPADRVATFPEEPQAIEHAMARMRPGGIVAIIADAPGVLEQLRPLIIAPPDQG